MKTTLALLLLMQTADAVLAQDTTGNFPPPSIPLQIHAGKAFEAIVVDGRLNEPDWKSAASTDNFFRIEPRQGGDYLYKTGVRVLFDKKYLYFGVFCKDSLGKRGIRVQDYRRDFNNNNNDFIAIQLDPQHLKRYCMSFQATPLGTQSDVQVFDDMLQDNQWDALWKVKTTTTDSGYYAEFAIPFSTLRYNKTKNDDPASFGVTFYRLARKNFEKTVFPAIPQSFSAYRMTYEAQLTGLQLPPPSVNIRVQPYTLYQFSNSRNEDNKENTKNTFKAGGDVKWALNTHSVLDLTFNTDFAQADVDGAVNNLTRFNVFFPEKRQFFLENNGVYAGASNPEIQPFFSRSIGLENTQYNANPVPIDVGARYTDRTTKRTIAGLYVRQEGTANQGATDFGVLRYLKNYGKQSNIGVMLTHRLDESEDNKGFAQHNNSTLTVDGLIRPTDKFSINYLVTSSYNNNKDSFGTAGSIQLEYSSNKIYFQHSTSWVSEKYVPGMGYVFQNNVIHHNLGGYLIIRPKKWKWIRDMEPDFFVNYYQNASDGKFQQASIYGSPVFVFFKDNSYLQASCTTDWQNINFDFTIFGLPVPKGHYTFPRFTFAYNTDQSTKYAVGAGYVSGKFYNGNLNTITGNIRIAPSPHVAFSGNYEYNQFKNFGTDKQNLNTHLVTGSVRLAYNPHILLTTFFQYNSYDQQVRWNARGSWEFAPLSFVYIVFNDNSFRETPLHNQSVINKITYLKQF